MNVSDLAVSSALTSVRVIHQFHPAISQGDAITDDLLCLQEIIRSWGFESDIYCQYPTSGITTKAYKDYFRRSHPNNLLLLHFSIGYSEEVLSFIERLPDKKILVYHNITPAQYFTGVNAIYERECARGRAQLPELARRCLFGIGDSEFNCYDLKVHGLDNTYVVPILINFEKYSQSPSSEITSKFDDGRTNILFVGRIAPNKRHDELLRSFACYQRLFEPTARLLLVGKYDGGMESYLDRLKVLAHALRCEDVYFTGHVSHADLLAYYNVANLFLCLSDHEGFCVPLLESMFFHVPIVACRAGAVPGTLGNAGILVEDRDPLFLAETIHQIRSDSRVAERIINGQNQRLRDFAREPIEATFKRALIEGLASGAKKAKRSSSILIEGTFEDHYSLSVVNRNLGLALDKKGAQVGFYATSGPGDYVPNLSQVADLRVKELWLRKQSNPEVSIRNIYPLRIDDMKGELRFWFFFWEETKIPKAWVELFNQLSGILAASRFVKEVLESCGVQVPIRVVPLGLDPELLHARHQDLPIRTRKRFVFLNVGSAFPRKGLDVLLAAFTREFSAQDDVCLVLKSFANIHNRVREMLASLPKDCGPEVIYLEENDMSAGALASLYARADCFVSPTRGEGFGLPLAEAMYFKVPVIVTNYGGHLDFCNEQTAVLIKYKLVPSQSHFSVKDSLWAEPSESDLRHAMRRVYEQKDSLEIKQMVERAYQKVTQYCSWEVAAGQALEFIQEAESKIIRLGMVTTWSQRCGIAEYSKYFLQVLPKYVKPVILSNRVSQSSRASNNQFPVFRCWDAGNQKRDFQELVDVVGRSELQAVHFQFNFSLFNLESFLSVNENLSRKGKIVIITFHSVRSLPELSRQFEKTSKRLRNVSLLLVHTEDDRKYLASLGLEQNVKVLPHGQLIFEPRSKEDIRSKLDLKHHPLIATFGFLLPHKGIVETIQAVSKLRQTFPEILFLVVSSLYPLLESEKYLRYCQEEVKRLGLERHILFLSDFLPSEEVAVVLQTADLIVLPYTTTKESSSAAIRFALAAQRPVMVTDLPIFSEFKDEVFKIESADPDVITEGIRAVLSSPEEVEKRVLKAKAYMQERTWDKVAKQYVSMLEEIREGRTEGSG